jgi:hypothetical protein
LLATVLGQDLEGGPDGVLRIARKVALTIRTGFVIAASASSRSADIVTRLTLTYEDGRTDRRTRVLTDERG